jgi:hypothetical protein
MQEELSQLERHKLLHEATQEYVKIINSTSNVHPSMIASWLYHLFKGYCIKHHLDQNDFID